MSLGQDIADAAPYGNYAFAETTSVEANSVELLESNNAARRNDRCREFLIRSFGESAGDRMESLGTRSTVKPAASIE